MKWLCRIIGHKWDLLVVPAYPFGWLGWIEKCRRCGKVKE